MQVQRVKKMRKMKKEGGTEKPEIMGAIDLVHLGREQRLSMLGKSHWLSRRERNRR